MQLDDLDGAKRFERVYDWTPSASLLPTTRIEHTKSQVRKIRSFFLKRLNEPVERRPSGSVTTKNELVIIQQSDRCLFVDRLDVYPETTAFQNVGHRIHNPLDSITSIDYEQKNIRIRCAEVSHSTHLRTLRITYQNDRPW